MPLKGYKVSVSVTFDGEKVNGGHHKAGLNYLGQAGPPAGWCSK